MLAQGNVGFPTMRQPCNGFPSPNPHGSTGALPVVGARPEQGLSTSLWCAPGAHQN
jgi:hypothetical protein